MCDTKRASFLIKLAIIICCIEEIFCQKDGAYYKKVWDEGVQKLREWKQPVENAEFKNHITTDCENFGKKYDFIIVGAGSTGSVLANRLTEESEQSVLLLEAGGDETEFSKMPGAFPAMLNSELNWGYLTVPQNYSCFGNNNRQCNFARGKVSGGGSSINAMMHVRGNIKDWQKSAMKTWSYKDVLPYFIKSENASAIGTKSSLRGCKGPLRISYSSPSPPLLNAVVEANKEEGYEQLDYNAQRQICVSGTQVNTNFGRRWSTNEAYLKPALHRNNLKIINKALATKIGFRNKVAVNVTFLNAGKCFVAKARKEIIISAGSVNSPQLLMLSGVGPKEELAKFNIPLIKDLPVGKYLEDHPALYNLPIYTNQSLSANLDLEFEKYAQGVGWLTYTTVLQLSFIQVGNYSVEDYPDVEVLYVLPKHDLNVGDITSNSFNYNQAANKFLMSMKPSSFLLHFMLLHPESKGEITLKSANPIDFPNINPNYLKEPIDIERIYLAIKKTLLLLETKAFRAIGAKLDDMVFEGCEGGPDDKDFWYCFIRHMTQGMYHPIGTCRMGCSSVDSVVDYKLRVHGLKRLRVVDVSVIRTSTSGHMNSAAVMIGEKMAKRIRKYYKF